jgi:hypothetical protein
MKKLIAIGALGLALGLPSFSFASDYMDLYTKPMVRGEVKNEIKSGNLEKDFTSFYISPKTANRPAALTSGQKPDEEYISIFGVQIPRGPSA